jgi:DNA polymerase-3 subunit delta
VSPDELQRELERGEIRSAFLLAGDEPLLRDDALAAIRAAVLEPGASDFNLDLIEGQATTPGALLDAVRTLPVMAARRLVVLREPVHRRAGSKALLDALADAVAEVSSRDEAVLVVATAKADRRQKWVKAFGDGLIDCDAPRRDRDLLGFVRAEAGRQGVGLEPAAAQLLVERVGPNLLLLRQEISKAALLAEPGEELGRDQLAASTSDVAEEPIWDLTDAIGEGRVGEALRVLHRLLEQGAAPPMVLGALASHMRKLARMRHGGRVGGPPFVVRKLEQQAGRYRGSRLLACLAAIAEVDEILKGRGGLPSDLALERLVMGLAA